MRIARIDSMGVITMPLPDKKLRSARLYICQAQACLADALADAKFAGVELAHTPGIVDLLRLAVRQLDAEDERTI